MPFQIILTEGSVTKAKAQLLHADIVELFMSIHGISNNPFMLPNVIGEVVFIDQGQTFSGKEVRDIAVIELKVPSFTFGTQDLKNQFIERATERVLAAAEGKLTKQQVWINAVYTVDGFWGIAGKAYSNAELGQAIQSSAHS